MGLRALFFLIENDSEIFTSEEILQEYCEVLKRDFEYDDQGVNQIKQKLLVFLTIIEPEEKIKILITASCKVFLSLKLRSIELSSSNKIY